MNNMYKNSISSFCSQFLYLVLLFLVRCFFVKTLGIEYQGLDSVMTSAVAILSLADLGIGTASVFALYKPLNEHRNDKIRSLISLYKKIYFVIISCLILFGMVMCIFVPAFIKDSIFSPWYIRKIFILFLLQTVSSYIFAEYQALFLANEKNYINSIYKSVISTISAVLQILSIVLLKNYYLKIATIIFANLVTNYLIRRKALSDYPFLKDPDRRVLSEEEKNGLFTDFKNLSVSRIADVLIFQTDNLFIAKLIGETIAGIYSNYYLIISGLNSVITCLITAIQPTFAKKLLKNHSNQETQKEIFNNFSSVSLIITSICICGYYVLFDGFISAWVGSANLLNRHTVLLLIITQLILLLDSPLWTMMYLNGAFKQIKSIGFFVSVINIIASCSLGMCIGLNGIVYGTIICYTISITLHFMYVFKSIIKDGKTVLKFAIKLLQFIISTSLSTLICESFYKSLVSFNIPVLSNLFIGIIICVVITLTINAVLFYKEIKKFISDIRKGTL